MCWDWRRIEKCDQQPEVFGSTNWKGRSIPNTTAFKAKVSLFLHWFQNWLELFVQHWTDNPLVTLCAGGIPWCKALEESQCSYHLDCGHPRWEMRWRSSSLCWASLEVWKSGDRWSIWRWEGYLKLDALGSQNGSGWRGCLVCTWFR